MTDLLTVSPLGFGVVDHEVKGDLVGVTRVNDLAIKKEITLCNEDTETKKETYNPVSKSGVPSGPSRVVQGSFKLD